LHISSADGSFRFGLNSTNRFPSDVGRWPKHRVGANLWDYSVHEVLSYFAVNAFRVAE